MLLADVRCKLDINDSHWAYASLMVNASGLIRSDAHVLVGNIQSNVPTKSNDHLLTGPDQPAASFECRLLPSLLARDLPWCLSWKMSNFVNIWFFTCGTVTFSNPASASELENVNWHTQIVLLKTTIIPCDIFQLCLGIWAPSASENIRQPRVQRFLIENHNCKMVTQECSAKNLECLFSKSFENI